jgi:sec-independent protein translocase protein TatC
LASKDLVKSEVDIDEDSESNGSEMTFLEHLEELRWRIIYSLIGLIAGAIICWIFINFLVDVILLKPARDSGIHLQNLRPFGQLMVYFQIAIIGGIILSLPNLFFQLWKFIAPALKSKERKYIVWIVMFSTLSFLIGIVFAYYALLPFTLKFIGHFGSPQIENNFAIDEYMSIIMSVMLGCGVVFELPLISYFLTRVGILKPEYMRKYRRYAIVGILIVAAFLTPPDPASQVVLAVPLVLLYEISIFISKIAVKKS